MGVFYMVTFFSNTFEGTHEVKIIEKNKIEYKIVFMLKIIMHLIIAL